MDSDNTNEKPTRELVKEHLVPSNEVLKILGITRQRLSMLTKTNKLVPVIKGIYYLPEVLERKKRFPNDQDSRP